MKVRLWRGLAPRIILVSLVCAALGVGLGFVGTAEGILTGVAERYSDLLSRALAAGEGARCSADPASWSLGSFDGARVHAYDPRTLRSANPAAPPLVPSLVSRWREGEVAPLELFVEGDLGGAALLDTGLPGACGLVQVAWAPSPTVRTRGLWTALIVSLLVLACAAAFGTVFAVRPLVRRIGRIGAAAESVGAPEGFTSARDRRPDELGRLSALLDRAHARIRADADALAAKTQGLERHLADVAHDLRTPIASLQLNLEHALSVTEDPELQATLTGAASDLVYLAGLVDDLRLAAQLEDGLDPSAGDPRVDLGAIVDRVVARQRPVARRKGMALDGARPDAPVPVRCHAVAAEQALGNLVQNAVAYGGPGGQVAVVLTTAGGRFALEVVDDGPGVAPSELPRLGERTFRSDDARRRDPKGTGLGLAITTEIATRCGWSIAFEQVEPRGLRVLVQGSRNDERPDPKA